MKLLDLLKLSVKRNASDIFIIAGIPLTLKINGQQFRLSEEGVLTDKDTAAAVQEIYKLAGRDERALHSADLDDDFSLSVSGMGRFRVNVFHQRGSIAAVVRVIVFCIPSPETLHILPSVMRAAKERRGLVLVTGPAASGKTTTLACLLEAISHSADGHIITVEDPVEYIHSHDRCIFTQREISTDVPDFLTALRSALRESPNVILLGEMRDCETMAATLRAAETGQLLFSSLHTIGAANTVDRIIDSFPASQQAQVRVQLSAVLKMVISQQLVPDVNGTLVPAFEIMTVNMAIRNLIRESKTHLIDSAIQAGTAEGMKTMDASLLELYEQGVISRETALTHCMNLGMLQKRLGT